MKCVYDHLAVGHIAFLSALASTVRRKCRAIRCSESYRNCKDRHVLTKHSRATTKHQVLGIVAVSTTQWFNFSDADLPVEDRRMLLDSIGLYGGLWRACVVVQDMGESIKSCGNIGSGNAKLNAVRAMSILCIMFSFMVMFTSIAIALASKKLALPSFLGSFLAMGTGISAVVVYAYFIDDINVTTLGRNDVLNWSYWLMVTAAALTGIPLLMNCMNAIKKWDVVQPSVVDPEEQVTPTEAQVEELPKPERVD
mmetsp:Transcript_9970/g.35405  ORF Transcript_9970/g.35405 Transcript_9970/m.35405 type:complete len:253 (-) Transcript_9970:136-894(-)